MTDEQAVKLANLLAAYVRDSVKEGATEGEALAWSVGATLEDIVSTTPAYLEHALEADARRLGA